MERNLLFGITSLIFAAQKAITYRWIGHMIIYEKIMVYHQYGNNTATINTIKIPMTANFRKDDTIHQCLSLCMFLPNGWSYCLLHTWSHGGLPSRECITNYCWPWFWCQGHQWSSNSATKVRLIMSPSPLRGPQRGQPRVYEVQYIENQLAFRDKLGI